MNNTQVEALVDAEVAVRNAMVQNSTNNPLYAELSKMQRKLLKLARAASNLRDAEESKQGRREMEAASYGPTPLG